MTRQPKNTRLTASRTLVLALLLVAPGCSPSKEGTATENFESLAAHASFFCTGCFVENHSPFSATFDFQRPQPDETDARFLLLAGRAGEPELEALLKHPDPKIRTLAMAALFQKEDPQMLPQIAALADDPAETFPLPGFPSQRYMGKIEDLPTSKQTVGAVATGMVKFYMERAGYFWGIKGGATDQPGFADYWQKRKDRQYCASWFAVQVIRAVGGSQSPTGDYSSDILLVRHRIDQLPPDERAWTLLWLRGLCDQYGPDFLVTQDELIKILQQLGPDKLLLALQRNIPMDDPDLALRSGNWDHYEAVTLFLLKQASALFRPQDADTLMALGQKDVEVSNAYSIQTAWWWIAAAQLQPARAGAILHQGYDTLRKVTLAADEFTPLTLSLWKSGGEKETTFLTEWYYRSDTEYAHFFHVQSRDEFIDSLVKSAQPSDKKFLAHLLQDPRSASIDCETLAHFANAINGWLPAPIVTQEELGRLSRHTVKGHGQEPEMVPGLLDRLQKSISQWAS